MHSSNPTRRQALQILSAAALLAAPFRPVAAETGSSPQLLAAQGRFALGLIEKLGGKSPAANIVISPASAAGAMAVVDLGADDKTRRTIHKMLGFTAGPTAWADLENLRRVTSRSTEGSPLASANRIVFDPSTGPYPEALSALANFGIEASVEDFSASDTLARINAWVADRTHGKIDKIIDEAPRNIGLVALNALYFKDDWARPFDTSLTASGPFNLVDGKTADAAMMNAQSGIFRFREDGRFLAVDLPYTTEGFSLIVVITKDKPAPVKAFDTLAPWLTGNDFSERPGTVSLPRFDASAQSDLMDPLIALGLKPQASLPGFSKMPQRISRIVQRVELYVDEKGTEAAAATAVTTTRSIAADFVRFVANRPFLFALRDQRSGLLVVAGYIAKPEVTS